VVIINSLETYSSNIMNWINRVLVKHPDIAQQAEKSFQAISDSFLSWVDEKLTPDAEAMLNSLGNLGDVIADVVSGVKVIIRFAKDFFIGLFISAYLLASKRRLIAQSKKLTYSVFGKHNGNLILRECRFIQTVFGGFVRGKLLDSLIIGIICFVGCSIFRFPYPVVVSVIVGVTNIIPFFGPVVGAIPSAFLILLVSPLKSLYFILFVFALQQFDGNVLGPKILGNKTGLTSFWVLFSILVFGGLFGFVGMVIGVPVFAVIYSIISTLVNHRLSKIDLSLQTADYELLDQVEESTGVFLHGHDPEVQAPDSKTPESKAPTPKTETPEKKD
jgi:predicted PurR-regulated permease PerM